MKLRHWLSPLLAAAGLAVAANASAPDDADREVVAITRDADDAVRERRIWFAWLDDVLYVRTTRLATWGRNVQRDGLVTLRTGDRELPFQAERVEDPDEQRRVHARFREKYGSGDWWADRVRPLFGGKVTLRLAPLPPG